MTAWTRILCLLVAALTAMAPAPAQDLAVQAGELVTHVAGRTAGLRTEFDLAVRQGIEGGPKAESKARKQSRNLDEAAQKLRVVFAAKKEKNDPAVRSQVEKTLDAAAELQRVILVNRFTPELRRDWEALRGDLNSLAQIYSLSLF